MWVYSSLQRALTFLCVTDIQRGMTSMRSRLTMQYSTKGAEPDYLAMFNEIQ